MVFADARKEFFVLKVEEDGGFFDFALFENLFDDFFAREAVATSFFEDFLNNIGDSSLFEAPTIKSVDAAADEDEAIIFNKFVVDSLDGNVFASKIGVADSLRDIRKMHRFFMFFENDVYFVANVFWVNGWPFGETPLMIKGG